MSAFVSSTTHQRIFIVKLIFEEVKPLVVISKNPNIYLLSFTSSLLKTLGEGSGDVFCRLF